MKGAGKIYIIVLGTLFFLGSTVVPYTSAGTVEDLQAELAKKKEALKSTEEKIAQFQQSIQEKRRMAQTLKDQIELIDESIEGIILSLQKTQAQIDQTDAEVAATGAEISQKEQQIEDKKVLLGQYIRQMQELDSQSSVTIFLKYRTLSDAIAESNIVGELQERAHEAIVSIQNARKELVIKKQDLEEFKQTLVALKTRQQKQHETLETQNQAKQAVLKQTKAQESQFQDLLQQAKQDAQQSQAAIDKLDSTIREQLRARGLGNLGSVGLFDWPIEPIFGVSCPFHCSGYPYAYLIGPHTGTDIPTYVGTPIKAPADGYVARNHDSGGRGYSYIMMVHGDNLSTVYGHVSGFAAREGSFVKRGTVIGYTGGAAGARGSGLSSGPHLHFEVRKNNVPVDGLGYLKPR